MYPKVLTTQARRANGTCNRVLHPRQHLQPQCQRPLIIYDLEHATLTLPRPSLCSYARLAKPRYHAAAIPLGRLTDITQPSISPASAQHAPLMTRPPSPRPVHFLQSAADQPPRSGTAAPAASIRHGEYPSSKCSLTCYGRHIRTRRSSITKSKAQRLRR